MKFAPKKDVWFVLRFDSDLEEWFSDQPMVSRVQADLEYDRLLGRGYEPDELKIVMEV